MCLPIKFLQVFVKINCLIFIVAGVIVETSSFYYLGAKVTQVCNNIYYRELHYKL